jgi:hypothetical protein
MIRDDVRYWERVSLSRWVAANIGLLAIEADGVSEGRSDGALPGWAGWRKCRRPPDVFCLFLRSFAPRHALQLTFGRFVELFPWSRLHFVTVSVDAQRGGGLHRQG